MAHDAYPTVLAVTNMYPTANRPYHGTFVASQIASLRKLGVTIDVVTIDGQSSRANYVKAISEIRRKLAVGHYDLLHAHFGLSGWVGRLQVRVPVVVSFCGSDILGCPAETWRRRRFIQATVLLSHLLERYVDAIIVKSEDMRRRLWLKSSRRRASVIPNGVDLEVFRQLPRTDALRELSLDPRLRYVLFADSSYAWNSLRKRRHLAEQTVEALSRKLKDVRLLVAREVPHELMPLYYSASSALLMASEREGSPNVVKEALACNLPVVSVDVGDVKERLAGVPGCAIVDATASSLAAALEKTLAVPLEGDLAAAVRPLSLESVAKQVLSVYWSVLSARKPCSE